MQVTINVLQLTAEINTILKVVASNSISIKASEGVLEISATNKGRSLLKRIECDVKEEGEFTVEPNYLLGVIRNREEVTLHLTEGALVVKSGRYKADVAILPYEKIFIEEPESNVEELDFTDSEISILLQLCNEVQLRSYQAEGQGALPIFIDIIDKGVTLTCLDKYHACQIKSKEITRSSKLSIVMQANTLGLLNDAASDGTYRVLLTESGLYADSDTFAFITPTEQVDAQMQNLQNFSGLIQRIKQQTKETSSVVVAKDQFISILENAYSVSEVGVPISLHTKKVKNKVVLSLGTKTSYGSAYEDIQCTLDGNEVDANFPADLLGEVADKFKGESLTLSILPTFMYVAEKSGARNSICIVVRT